MHFLWKQFVFILVAQVCNAVSIDLRGEDLFGYIEMVITANKGVKIDPI